MPASYPNSAKSFTTKSNGGTIDASHVNDLQLEVSAIETDLINGLPIARGGTGLTSLTANRIPYGNGTGALQSSASLTFDGSIFTTAAIVATTVTPSGLIDASGAAAGQLKFPATQNASTNANTMDDYEEGDWTPSIGGSGGQSGQVYTTQVGKYVKIGKMVFCQFRVQLSTLGTITTNVQIQGLPFTAENTTNQSASLSIGLWLNLTTAVVYVGGRLEPNTTAITLSAATAAATSLANLAQADLANTSYFDGFIAYRATA